MSDAGLRPRLFRYAWTGLAALQAVWLGIYGLRQAEGVPAYLLVPIWALSWAVAMTLWRLYFFERADRPLRPRTEIISFGGNLLLALFVLMRLGPKSVVLLLPLLVLAFSTLLVTGLYLYRKPAPTR